MSHASSFGALRHPGFRMFFIGNATAMLADNMEHVISYWMMYQKFHSPWLSGFAVIAHWLPFLLFSLPIGALADRVDPRRLIQIGMLLFVGVSAGWGVLFATDSLQIWHCVVLLTVHGIAGVFWAAPSQLFLHDIVSPELLQSAVRSNAMSRYVGTMLGPAVGSALMLWLSPSHALLLNTLVYLPLLLWLINAPYGPRFGALRHATTPFKGVSDLIDTARLVAIHPVLLGMTLLTALSSLLVGNAYQAQMPGFATLLGHADPGVAYSALLAADAAGALSAGFLLESMNWLKPAASKALLLAALWCAALALFALTARYELALVLLFAAGFLELSCGAMTQTLVQLHAPAEVRGRVIGFYVMAGFGTRTFSGVTVGLLGDVIGIRASLSLSAGLLLMLIAVLWWRITPRAPSSPS